MLSNQTNLVWAILKSISMSRCTATKTSRICTTISASKKKLSRSLFQHSPFTPKTTRSACTSSRQLRLSRKRTARSCWGPQSTVVTPVTFRAQSFPNAGTICHAWSSSIFWKIKTLQTEEIDQNRY